MSLVTIIWSMIASACLTLAGIHFLLWRKSRRAWTNLLFCLTAVGTAIFAFCELRMMDAATPAGLATTLKWGHVAVWALYLSLVGFVRFYLRAGRPGLAWAVCGTRTLALLLNFLVGQNLNYLKVASLGHVSFLGESVSIPEGVVHNPWMLVGQLSLVLFVVFAADASFTVWRRGDRRIALTVGGSIVFFSLASVFQSVVVLWGIVKVPLTATPFFMGMVAMMGYELSYDALRTSQLDRELHLSEAGLHESEERMRLAVEAADFGIWIRDLVRNEIWATDRWRSLFGFDHEERLKLDNILQRVHPEDRDAVRSVLSKAMDGGGSYEAEFRLVFPAGTFAGLDRTAVSSSTTPEEPFSCAACRLILRSESKLSRRCGSYNRKSRT